MGPPLRGRPLFPIDRYPLTVYTGPMRSAVSVFLVLYIFLALPAVVFGQSLNVQDTLEGVNADRYPAELQSSTDQVGYLSFLCDNFISNIFSGWLDQLLVCQGTKTQNIEVPASATVKVTKEDLALLEEAVEQLESGTVAGTDSAQVQGIFDFLTVLDSIYHDEETGFTRNYTPAGKTFTNQRGQAGAEESTRIVATKQLMPAARGSAEQPSEDPDVTPDITPGVPSTPPGGMCSFGSNDCSVENLRTYFSTELAAQQASIICQRESGSNPAASNKTCKRPSGTLDYSIGLFQINLLAHCSSNMLKDYYPGGYSGPAFNARDVFKYNGSSPAFPPCVVLDQQKLDMCEEVMLVAENNIDVAKRMSSDGQNWVPWSAAKACGIVGGQPLPTPTQGVNGHTPVYASCQNSGSSVMVPNTTYQHLSQRFECVEPKIFVVHWSAAWSTAQATYNVLNTRNRSCQFAIDKNTSIQMLDFYKTAMRKGWCAGGVYNDMSINYELTGVWFDEVINDAGELNTQHARYNELLAETDKAIGITCWAVKFYGMDKKEVYGHFQIQSGKSDPGPKYLEYFKKRVLAEC